MGEPDARPPRVRPHSRRRDHHGSAGPGICQRGRHGHRRALAGRPVQPAGPCDRGALYLWHRGRRRPDGGGFLRGRVAGRSSRARQADLSVRRQQDHDRREHGPGVHRGRRPALRGLRLARAAGGRRERPGCGGGGDPRRAAGDRPALPRHVPDPHRVRESEPAGFQQGPRRAAGRGRARAHQAEARLARVAGVPGAGRGAAGVPQGGGARREMGGGVAAAPAGVCGGLSDRGGPLEPLDERRAAGGLGRGAAAVRAGRSGRGHAGRVGEGHPGGVRTGGESCRWVGGPGPVEQHLRPGRRRFPGGHPRRAEFPLRSARARHGGHRQRDGAARRTSPLHGDVPGLFRLHAAAHSPGGSDGDSGRLHLHARQHRSGGGRSYPPARGARDGPADHPGAARDPAGRRDGDGGSLAGGAHAPRPHVSDPDPAEPADPGSHRGAARLGGGARSLHPRRGAGRESPSDPDRHGLRGAIGRRRAKDLTGERGDGPRGEHAVLGAVRGAAAGLP